MMKNNNKFESENNRIKKDVSKNTSIIFAHDCSIVIGESNLEEAK